MPNNETYTEADTVNIEKMQQIMAVTTTYDTDTGEIIDTDFELVASY